MKALFQSVFGITVVVAAFLVIVLAMIYSALRRVKPLEVKSRFLSVAPEFGLTEEEIKLELLREWIALRQTAASDDEFRGLMAQLVPNVFGYDNDPSYLLARTYAPPHRWPTRSRR
jgi:hypothetical protein